MTEAVWKTYEKLELLGEGTYGEVYKASTKKSNKPVAIKLLKNLDRISSFCDIPYTSLREVSILKDLDHPNIVKLKAISFDLASFAMVFDYYPQNLRHIITGDKRQALTPKLIKKIIYQLVSGIDYLHRNGMLHRDLKPENVLVDSGYNTYIADFGLARPICQPLREYTNEVMTLYYRPPELVFGEKKYSTAVDVWSLGCLAAEIMTGKILFKGIGELEMLFLIFETFGVPSTAEWPEFDRLLKLTNLKFQMPRIRPSETLKEKLKGVDAQAFDLVSRMLTLNPLKRPSCRELLAHPWLAEFVYG